ncbi:hypothetical protein HPP92_028031, partial [Vanilla planifolia]
SFKQIMVSCQPNGKYEVSPPPVFDAAVLSRQSEIPVQFVWPEEDKPTPDTHEELHVPLIDLGGFNSDQPEVAAEVVRQVGVACAEHGFFQVVNHGVPYELVSEAQRCMESFFSMPLCEKERAKRKPGESCGYASSFTGRFSSKLPWKETLSFSFSPFSSIVLDYFIGALGEEFRQFGWVPFSRTSTSCLRRETGTFLRAGVSGILRGNERALVEDNGDVGDEPRDRSSTFQGFFLSNESIMRLNYYPPCQKPELTLGTGPHCDPTSLTILHQDDVGGLQVFTDGRWRTIAPKTNAFVVNIGDTLMASSVECEVQELSTQGGCEQGVCKEVVGLLPLPEDEQAGKAAGHFGRPRPPASLPRFHVVRPARVHTEALQSRHEHS